MKRFIVQTFDVAAGATNVVAIRGRYRTDVFDWSGVVVGRAWAMDARVSRYHALLSARINLATRRQVRRHMNLVAKGR